MLHPVSLSSSFCRQKGLRQSLLWFNSFRRGLGTGRPLLNDIPIQSGRSCVEQESRDPDDCPLHRFRSQLIGTNLPNIAADFVIIILPVRVIWQLKLSMLRRIELICIFLLAFM